ncbi:MAG: hypothetical protein IJA02_09000 [Clostridia bacterium]|nr:hypothetical protein [Clostridia bacterium]
MNNYLIIAISSIAVLSALSITAIIAYRRVIKDTKTYARTKPHNGDILLDDICPKYLKLTNVDKGTDDVNEQSNA